MPLRRLARSAIAGTLVALAAVPGLMGQIAREVTECASFAPIEMTREIRIPDVGPERLGPAVSYATDSRGRLWAARHGRNTVISVFGPDGVLEADLGGRGSEAGEFGAVIGITIADGDSAHVFDVKNRTHTVFAPTLEFARRVSLPASPFHNAIVRLPGGQWVIGAIVETPERVGLPLHLLNETGDVESSFGAVDPVYRMDLRNLSSRVLATAGREEVWAARRSEYRIELWDTGNTLHKVLVRNLAWFRPWARDVATTPDIPRNPYVRDVRVDGAGLLWVLITRTSERFAEHVAADENGRYYWTSDTGYWASVVEVIDPERACVVGRIETESNLQRSMGNGRYAGYDEQNGGHLDVWMLRIGG